MKRLFVGIILCLCACTYMSAQKTTVKFRDTQARLLDVMSTGYVKPLVAELSVNQELGRVNKVYYLSNEEVAEMDGKIENIRSYAVYRMSADYDADVIVAATFSLQSTDDGKGYTIEVKGFPANFVNWHSATEEDYEWIRMEKGDLDSNKRSEAISK